MFHLSIPGKTPKTLATTLALLLCLLLAPLSEAQAGTFRCQYFTLNLPQNWKLINGPFKKGGGETAVLGRRDHKASVQMLCGTSVKENFKTIVEGYARGLRASPKFMGTSQAWFDTTRKGQQLRFIFCQDEAAQVLAIYILNGTPKDMDFIRTGMKTKYRGLVPQKLPAR